MQDIEYYLYYEREDYQNIRLIMTDWLHLPATYDVWLDETKNEVERILSDGRRPVKIDLHSDAFKAFCESRGLNINNEGRAAFVSDFRNRNAPY